MIVLILIVDLYRYFCYGVESDIFHYSVSSANAIRLRYPQQFTELFVKITLKLRLY